MLKAKDIKRLIRKMNSNSVVGIKKIESFIIQL